MANAPKAVVMGGSAGAIDALSAILPLLPGDYPVPVFVAVHQAVDKASLIASLFAQKCELSVLEAEDKMPIQGGTIYFAPPDYHLLIEEEGHFSLSVDDPVNFSRPSIDVLMESAADAYGGCLIGVILTGANADGALGLKRICEQGGLGLVQHPDGAYASAMPQAALESCPNVRPMTLEEITAELISVMDAWKWNGDA
jgi:two-component system chemotaxis response regulator CheB